MYNYIYKNIYMYNYVNKYNYIFLVFLFDNSYTF